MAALALLADAAHADVLDDHAVAGRQTHDVPADLQHLGRDLVAERDMIVRPLSDEMEVRAAHAARMHLDDDTVVARGREFMLAHLDVEVLLAVESFADHG